MGAVWQAVSRTSAIVRDSHPRCQAEPAFPRICKNCTSARQSDYHCKHSRSAHEATNAQLFQSPGRGHASDMVQQPSGGPGRCVHSRIRTMATSESCSRSSGSSTEPPIIRDMRTAPPFGPRVRDSIHDFGFLQKACSYLHGFMLMLIAGSCAKHRLHKVSQGHSIRCTSE